MISPPFSPMFSPLITPDFSPLDGPTLPSDDVPAFQLVVTEAPETLDCSLGRAGTFTRTATPRASVDIDQLALDEDARFTRKTFSPPMASPTSLIKGKSRNLEAPSRSTKRAHVPEDHIESSANSSSPNEPNVATTEKLYRLIVVSKHAMSWTKRRELIQVPFEDVINDYELFQRVRRGFEQEIPWLLRRSPFKEFFYCHVKEVRPVVMFFHHDSVRLTIPWIPCPQPKDFVLPYYKFSELRPGSSHVAPKLDPGELRKRLMEPPADQYGSYDAPCGPYFPKLRGAPLQLGSGRPSYNRRHTYGIEVVSEGFSRNVLACLLAVIGLLTISYLIFRLRYVYWLFQIIVLPALLLATGLLWGELRIGGEDREVLALQKERIA